MKIKLKDIIYLLNGNFNLFDNETDCSGATLVLDKTMQFNEKKQVIYVSDFHLTDYGMMRFEKVLNSEVIAINDDGYIMLDCEWDYIGGFLNACSGNIAENEYNRLFKQ